MLNSEKICNNESKMTKKKVSGPGPRLQLKPCKVIVTIHYFVLPYIKEDFERSDLLNASPMLLHCRLMGMRWTSTDTKCVLS